MSFFAAASEIQNPIEANVESGPFWPVVNVSKLREVMRLDGTVTTPRLQNATINAVASVNSELREWRIKHQSAGHDCLADIPGEIINAESVYSHLYARAIYCLTRANLVERLRDYDTTKSGADATEPLDLTITNLRRDARFAIRDMLGIPHLTAELL